MVVDKSPSAILPSVYITDDILMYLLTPHVDRGILLQTLPLTLACPRTAGTTRHYKIDDVNKNKYQHLIFSQPNIQFDRSYDNQIAFSIKHFY